MSSFRDQPFSVRFGALGDEAEAAFEDWASNIAKLAWDRYGLCRPNVHMGMLSDKTRYTPDYLMSKCMVEVQGFGRDQLFKLKLEKLAALREWHKYDAPVFLFAWDSKHKRSWIVPLEAITKAASNMEFEIGVFPEGKEYLEIPATWFEQHIAALDAHTL